MMIELLMNLVCAVGEADREEAYRGLERIGIDRETADAMASNF